MAVSLVFSLDTPERRAVIRIPRQETLVLLSGQSAVRVLEDASDMRIDVVETPWKVAPAPESAPEDEDIFDADLNGEDDGVS